MAEELPGGYREVWRVAYPLIVSMASFTMMQFCDRMFLAWYSSAAIRAALPAGILSFTMICGFMALAGYANTFVAQYHGAQDKKGCSLSVAQGIFLALLSWPLIMLLIPVGTLIIQWSGHAPEVEQAELVYYRILMLGGVAVPLSSAIGSFYTGRGDTFTNMIATLAGNLLNILLDYIMIFGKWGCPEMGIAGAAWATVISGFLAPLMLGIMVYSKKNAAAYGTRQYLRWDAPLMARMLRFGVPSALHLVLDVGAFAFFILLVGRLSPDDVAASNIAFGINNLAFMPLLGFSIAASILVGQYQGRQDSAHAVRATWTSLKMGSYYMIFIGLTFLLFPRFYFGLFTGAEEHLVALEDVLPRGRWLLAMMAAWGLLDNANLVFSGALKGAGDTRFVMLYNVSAAWGIWILGELVILFVLKGGLIMAWLWLTFYVCILAGGFYWRFKSGRWKTIELIERPVPPTPLHPATDALTVAE